MTENEAYEQVARMSMGEAIFRALDQSQAMPDIEGTDGQIHRGRSKNFVECLGEEMLGLCQGVESVVSLTKHNEANRARFGMNELLYDVAVVQYDTVDSGKSGKELSYVTRGLWIVESELARNKREALYDFNKLVLGDAEHKLFVGPRNADEEDYLRVLAEPAKHCAGNLWLALIPHPDQWPVVAADEVRVWRWGASGWASA